MTTEAEDREWPETFWYLETRAGTRYVIDEATADTVWDALRQGHPHALELTTLTGVLWRGPLWNVAEVTRATPESSRANIAFNTWNEKRCKEMEREADPEKFLRGDD